MNVNIERIKRNLGEIGAIGKDETPGYNRPAFGSREEEAIRWLQRYVEALDIPVRRDGVGNAYAKWGASDQPAVAFGSHLDTVPNGGLFDGALGVVVGLECLEVLKENGVRPSAALELICFVGEEANPLGGTFGSRAATGRIEQNETVDRKLSEQGFSREDVGNAERTADEFQAFLEMHIEQGQVLEKAEIPVGIVTSIAGILRFRVTFFGRAAHAGTTPMAMREDALVRASAFVQDVFRCADERDDSTVATVGTLDVRPGAANVVPGEVELTVEIRGSGTEEMEALEADLLDQLKRTGNNETERTVYKKPVHLSERVQETMEQAAADASVSSKRMLSGANHDAGSMTALTDVGMLFIPSIGGISHHPDEESSWEDIEQGANVMLHTIIRLIGKK